MQGLLQLVLAAATLVSLTEALPTTESHVGSFSVKQVKNPNFKRSGVDAFAHAFHKYGKEMPSYLKEALASKSSKDGNDGSVTATPSDQYDSEYLCPVSIGGQTLNLDFDTGSSDLYVIVPLLYCCHN
jgi:aspergillopepsin I